MTAVFLNGMIDPPDLYSDAVAEDLSYNEMESVLEVFVERVLQYEDFFKEYDDDDAGKTLLKKYSSLDVLLFSDSLAMAFPDQCTSNLRSSMVESHGITFLNKPVAVWLSLSPKGRRYPSRSAPAVTGSIAKPA